MTTPTTIPTISAKELTPARLRALEVVAKHHPHWVRESNETHAEAGHVYWQSARWMDEKGLITWVSPPNFNFSPAGAAFAAARGLL